MQDLTIDRDLLEKLKTLGTLRKLDQDAVVLDEHDAIHAIPIVLSGIIKVLRTDDDFREILLYYIKPGESCVMSFLGATCHTRSAIRAVVEEPAEILMLPIHHAADLIKTHPAWMTFIFQLYNRRFEELLSVINAMAFQKIDERLWSLLQKKAAISGSSELQVTHQQLADELGTAREVVSRLLKQLERNQSIILSRNKVTILRVV